jgi:ribosome-binding factor A
VNRRLYKVNESLREVVSEAIDREVKDPRLGFVTVTGVETSPDLREARVYVSVLGDQAQRDETLAALQSAHGLLQARVAARIRLKRTPRLTFLYDDTTDRAMHIDDLLRRQAEELAAVRGDRDADSGSDTVDGNDTGSDEGAARDDDLRRDDA